MKRSLLHVAGLVFNQPHAITPEKLEIIRDVLAASIQRGSMAWQDDDEDDEPASEPASGSSFPVTVDGIALIPVQGTLVRRSVGMNALSGLRSYDDILSDFNEALESPEVKGIIFRHDSPGGSAAGCLDASDAIFSARGQKPMYAVAEGQMCSASYALGCATDRVYGSRDCLVGSIGTIMIHRDLSAADKQEGVKYTLITYGEHKADGNEHEPLSKDGLALYRSIVDGCGAQFTDTVARNMDIPAESIRALQARVYFGQQALAAGLVHKMGGMDDALADMRTALGLPQNPADSPDEADTSDAFGMSSKSLIEAETLASAAQYKDIPPEAITRLEMFTGKTKLAGLIAARCFNPAMLAGDPGKQHITGCPVPYGVLSRDLGGFKELYEPGCFAESIEQDDIYALFNHHEDHVLGRKSAGTLAITEDPTGVHFDITPPSKDWAEALVESMQRGDIDGMSAAFYITKYRWEMRDGWRVRVIQSARMVESSVATFPFFKTSAAVTPAATHVLSQLQQKLNRARLESAKIPLN